MDLRSFFSKKSAAKPSEPILPEPENVRPEQAHFIVGDLHGRADLLERILEAIDQVIGAERVENPVLCFVGNSIDRGPDSRATLRRMKELTDEFPLNVISLMGNHEQMLLDFLQAPTARYARWLREGGDATCRSFGIPLTTPEIAADDAEALAGALHEALSDELKDWLSARPVRQRSGNLSVVHAGADPVHDIEDQTDRVMIWGHPEFLTRPRVDGQWIAHGHHIVERAHAKDGRISVNTDAWKTGILSCAYVPVSGDLQFLSVTD